MPTHRSRIEIASSCRVPALMTVLLGFLVPGAGAAPIRLDVVRDNSSIENRKDALFWLAMSDSDTAYEFLDRLIAIAIPRIRDFRGMSVKSLDGRGNYSMGIQEQIIFAEIDYDHIDVIRGMDITITTSARNNEEGQALLEAFSFPFKK